MNILSIYDYEYEDKVILYIPVFESDLVHSTKGEVFDRNVDGDYKVTSPERIANIYARKQKVNTEDELFPYKCFYPIHTKYRKQFLHH